MSSADQLAAGVPRCRPAGAGPQRVFNCVSCYRWNELSVKKANAFKALMEVAKKSPPVRERGHTPATTNVGSLHDSRRLRSEGS